MTMWKWFFLLVLSALPMQAPTAARSAEVDYYTEILALSWLVYDELQELIRKRLYR